MKVKRRKDRNITSFTVGHVSYEFKGKGPFEIEDTHFPYLQEYFDKVEEKKTALPEKQEVPNG